jgi:hypothetical protein
MDVDLLDSAGRASALQRVRHEAESLGKTFDDTNFQHVVSPLVVAKLSPVLEEARLACLMLFLLAGKGNLDCDEYDKAVARIKAPVGELSGPFHK